MFKSLPLGAVVFVWIVSAIPNAIAYIPPANYIVKTWVNKHRGVKSVRIWSVITAFENNQPTPFHFKETASFSFETLTFRSVATDDHDKKLYQIEKGFSALSLASKLLLAASEEDLFVQLKARAILPFYEGQMNGASPALKRLGAKIAWVLGGSEVSRSNQSLANQSQANQSFEPQLWFEKDAFFPIRLLLINSSEQGFDDFRFENFKYTREMPYPQRITVIKRKNETLLTVQLTEIQINGEGSGSRQTHSLPVDGSLTSSGDSSASRLKDLIRTYYDLVR
jgi:hypothetical protein